MRGVYPIIDFDASAAAERDPLALGLAVIEARPPLLQLRAKSASARETLELLRALRKPAALAGVRLFANDRPDLALLAECDGVHVGQDDVPLSEVRRFAPQLSVGVSTHDPDQLARALEQRPDYVAYGPVYSTRSKAQPDPVVGIAGLAEAARAARARGIPLVAIGGIDCERIAEVAEHADAAAVISALLTTRVSDRVRQLARAFGERP